FGIVVLIWQEGWASQLIGGVPATGAIVNWVPLAIFAFLYGLSMDYEVFILSRVREEYDRTGSTDEAVVRGIGSTGRLVTSAALIVFSPSPRWRPATRSTSRCSPPASPRASSSTPSWSARCWCRRP